MSCTCDVSIWYSESEWGTLNLCNLQFLKLTSHFYFTAFQFIFSLPSNMDTFTCRQHRLCSAVLPYINFISSISLSLIKELTKNWGVQLIHDNAGNIPLSRHHLNFHNFPFLLDTHAQPPCTSGC
jgi:hypothetical protein